MTRSGILGPFTVRLVDTVASVASVVSVLHMETSKAMVVDLGATVDVDMEDDMAAMTCTAHEKSFAPSLLLMKSYTPYS